MAEPAGAGVAGAPVRELQRARSRAAWTLTDQVLSSLTNFALAVIVARQSSTEQFGAFAVAYTLFTVGVGVSRAMCNEPMVVRFSHRHADDVTEAGRAMTGVALLFGLALGAVFLGVSLVVDDTLGAAFAALAICLPLVFWQDALRSLCFAARRAHLAAMNDALWAVGLVVAVLLPVVRSASTPTPIIIAWGVSAGLAAVVTAIVVRLPPSFPSARSWLRDHADLGGRFVVEFLLLTGGMHVVIFSAAIFAGLDQAGSLRGALSILGPATVVIYGAVSVAVPEGARLANAGTRRLHVLVYSVTGLLMAAVLAWTAVLALIPDRLGEALLGATWAGTRSVIVPFGITVAGAAGIVGLTVGLRALAAARRSLRANMISTLLLVTGGVVGGIIDGAIGAAVGMIVPSWLGVLTYWWQFRLAADDRGSAGAPAEHDVEDGDA